MDETKPQHWKNKSTGSTPIGDRIKQERFRRDITLQELCDAAGICPATLTSIENRGGVPSLATLIKIAAALDCTLDFLAGV